MTIWRDGQLTEAEPSPEPMRAAWGAFTTVGCARGRPLLWDRHRRRLGASLAVLGPKAPAPDLPTEDDLEDLLGEHGPAAPARLRVVARLLGVQQWTVEATASACDVVGPTLVPVDLGVVRWAAAAPLCGHKTLARLPWDIARQTACHAGADDALIVDEAGWVLETSVCNVVVVSGTGLVTPSAPEGCLPGIMRGWLLEAAPRLGLSPQERNLTLAELLSADEVWLTNAVQGIRRVARVGDRSWDAWDVFPRLQGLQVPAPGW